MLDTEVHILHSEQAHSNARHFLLCVSISVPVWQVVKNVAAFCACAGTGQLFVFFIIKEFGSLVNVTVTISRKFFRSDTSLFTRCENTPGAGRGGGGVGGSVRPIVLFVRLVFKVV